MITSECKYNTTEIEAYWQAYLASLPATVTPPTAYEAWSFGHTTELADRLGNLAKTGVKTATTSLMWSYEAEQASLPQVGSSSIILDGKGSPLCIIETIAVEVKAFGMVDERFAYDEGEGDRSLAYWRQVHWEVYAADCAALGRTPAEDMPVVCERFRVIYPLSQMFVANWMNITELVPLLVREGFGIEIQDFCDPTRLDDHEYLKQLQTAIAPIASRALHGPYSELIPVSRDPEIRTVTLKRFNRAYALARELQATHLILHSGFIPKTYPPERWLQNALDFWTQFLADKHDAIDIHLENVYEDRFDLLQALIDRLAHPRISICLDIGHVNANSSLSLKSWITGLGNRIRYVHLHNNYGILDDHFGLWNGTIDMPHTLRLLMAFAPQPALSIETVADHVVCSMGWLKEVSA